MPCLVRVGLTESEVHPNPSISPYFVITCYGIDAHACGVEYAATTKQTMAVLQLLVGFDESEKRHPWLIGSDACRALGNNALGLITSTR